jgi:hypothetical protein
MLLLEADEKLLAGNDGTAIRDWGVLMAMLMI